MRIPRPPAPDAARPVRTPVLRPSVEKAASVPVERRTNQGGTRRVVRLSVLFWVALGGLYGGFLAAAVQSSRQGFGAGALEVFSGVALALAVAGGLLTLSPAPRAVEVSPDSIVVVGRWGTRTEWAPRESVGVRIVRRYPAGWLSPVALESIELVGLGRRSTYLVEAGTVPEAIAGKLPELGPS